MISSWLIAAAMVTIPEEHTSACVSVNTGEGWRPTAEMEIQLTSGQALNDRIGHRRYQPEKSYAVLDLGQHGRLALLLEIPELGAWEHEVKEEDQPVWWRLRRRGALGCTD
ncbi:hypothetical protein [Chitinimonas sp. BJB300]|uniref:hypothetical protein n=1 Tax=Chitinimonas sp. BJB300 TaxID=1559339 RepID=UPI0011124401|nr:hypothetical protein [Chitinimonas sp. BJB300]TSJ83871.1 hypothetical protein FG002_020295 [Chitinimonas sp. BJB300]